MTEKKLYKHTTFKCLTSYSSNKNDDKILTNIGSISKNIWNISIYCKQVYDLYKTKIFKELFAKLNKDINFDSKTFINEKALQYHKDYSSMRENINSNNNIIYKAITDSLAVNNIIVTTSNIDVLIGKSIIGIKLEHDIFIDDDNNDILYENIIKQVYVSIYRRNYRTIKYEMTNHNPYSIISDDIINDIKNNTAMKEFSNTDIYKKKVESLLKEKNKGKINADQSIVDALVRKTLGDNHGKIDSTMTGTIIGKVYSSFNSYFELIAKNLKANKPKYLGKNDLFTLTYNPSKNIKNKETKTIRIYTSRYISENLDAINSNYVCVYKYRYVLKKHLQIVTSKVKISKKDNYILNDGTTSYYINKSSKYVIDSRYIYIPYPLQLHDKKLGTIEIVFENERIKYCINYETNEKAKIIGIGERIKERDYGSRYVINYETNEDGIYDNTLNINKPYQIMPNDAISIDLGVKNFATIYDPNGKQIIIPGNFILSANYHYRKLIGKAQTNKNKKKRNKLELKRKNTIDNIFDKIVKWIEKNYSHKKLIIIGKNNGWKNGTNLRGSNYSFQKIPYAAFISKMNDKFINQGVIIEVIEESYTSKCDALAFEKIGKSTNGKYLGERKRRGLFQSSVGKLLNADINGAINIMRKVMKDSDMNISTAINICNPGRINVFDDIKKTIATNNKRIHRSFIHRVQRKHKCFTKDVNKLIVHKSRTEKEEIKNIKKIDKYCNQFIAYTNIILHIPTDSYIINDNSGMNYLNQGINSSSDY
jgi:IS605 OrfB family transposase